MQLALIALVIFPFQVHPEPSPISWLPLHSPAAGCEYLVKDLLSFGACSTPIDRGKGRSIIHQIPRLLSGADCCFAFWGGTLLGLLVGQGEFWEFWGVLGGGNHCPPTGYCLAALLPAKAYHTAMAIGSGFRGIERRSPDKTTGAKRRGPVTARPCFATDRQRRKHPAAQHRHHHSQQTQPELWLNYYSLLLLPFENEVMGPSFREWGDPASQLWAFEAFF